jgi:hypothetical protein
VVVAACMRSPAGWGESSGPVEWGESIGPVEWGEISEQPVSNPVVNLV